MMDLKLENMDEAVTKGKGIEISWGPVDLGGSKRAEIKASAAYKVVT